MRQVPQYFDYLQSPDNPKNKNKGKKTVKTTLETSGKVGKTTLETSGEDVKTTLGTSGEGQVSLNDLKRDPSFSGNCTLNKKYLNNTQTTNK